MVKAGLQNWKTTIIGAVIAGLYAVQNAGNLDAKHLAVAFAFAAFGFLAHDGQTAK